MPWFWVPGSGFRILGLGVGFRVYNSEPRSWTQHPVRQAGPPAAQTFRPPLLRPCIRVSSFEFRFEFWVPGFRFRASDFEFAVFGFRVSGFRFRVSGFGFRVSGFRFRDSSFGFRVWISGFGFQASGFVFRVSGLKFRFRVWGCGFWDSGLGFRFRVSGFGVHRP